MKDGLQDRTRQRSMPKISKALTPKRQSHRQGSGFEIKLTREIASRTVVTEEVVTTDSIQLKIP